MKIVDGFPCCPVCAQKQIGVYMEVKLKRNGETYYECSICSYSFNLKDKLTGEIVNE